jgi:hypothetical protein
VIIILHHQQTHISDFLVFSFVFRCVFGSLVRAGGSNGEKGSENEELIEYKGTAFIFLLKLLKMIE